MPCSLLRDRYGGHRIKTSRTLEKLPQEEQRGASLYLSFPICKVRITEHLGELEKLQFLEPQNPYSSLAGFVRTHARKSQGGSAGNKFFFPDYYMVQCQD